MGNILHKRRQVRASEIRKVLLSFIFLLAISSSALSQINGEENTIFITGQVTNNVNGAPVSNHKIFIESDSVANNGFYFYSAIYTDVNGFYYDTVKTTNNDGSLEISLYDFEQELHEATKYYRFNWSDKYTIVADFFIHDPNAHSTYQANFEAQEDTSVTHPLRVHFHDESIGFVIKSWLWDFGDGTYSDIQDPVHDFPEPGMYMVSLTISSHPLVNETDKISTITKQVFVGLSDYYNMGGHVFTDVWPIDHGLAYLYMIDDTEYPSPVDTAAIDTLGYYYFYQVIEGNYIVKTRLARESEKYGQYIPTYYGNSYNWQEASVIELDENAWNYHVDLLTSEGTESGIGQITGQILYDTNTITTTFSPAQNIEIILLNGTSACLTCNLSDLDGNFSFGDLEFGTYQVFPDVTGIKAEPMFITISEDTPGEIPFNVVIQREQITFGIEDNPAIAEETINFWPNPVIGQATFSFTLEESAAVSIRLANQGGQLVMHEDFTLTKGKQSLELDLSSLGSGIYYLIAEFPGGKPISVKVLKL
jgi:PKD repeat protein